MKTDAVVVIPLVGDKDLSFFDTVEEFVSEFTVKGFDSIFVVGKHQLSSHPARSNRNYWDFLIF